VLPNPEEAPALVPAPGSIVWTYAGDARLLATAGYALMLQVAHPTVGAGVSEHSSFKSDPWGRLLRTLDYTYTMVYGGPQQAASMGRRVREMHKQIRGIRPDGERYHALEPEAYAWVHATLAEAIITGHRRFGRRMHPDEIERFYADWIANGRLLGVRERDLPGDWTAFRSYLDAMIHDRLENNPAVQDVLAALADPAPPPIPGLGNGVWRTLRIPAVRLLSLATVGLLPPLLRTRFGVRWTPAQERELRALSALSRAATPALPRSLGNVGPRYLRWRRRATAGDPGAFGPTPRGRLQRGAPAPAH
jgi:uncharacterized protein (DUF2236 family)